jgi:hypothetical protein
MWPIRLIEKQNLGCKISMVYSLLIGNFVTIKKNCGFGGQISLQSHVGCKIGSKLKKAKIIYCTKKIKTSRHFRKFLSDSKEENKVH